ncbi:hypothetical protein LguiB_036000 [Lonicera macranthoides]
MIRPVFISFLRNENIELIEGKTGHYVSLCHYIMAAFERALTLQGVGEAKASPIKGQRQRKKHKPVAKRENERSYAALDKLHENLDMHAREAPYYYRRACCSTYLSAEERSALHYMLAHPVKLLAKKDSKTLLRLLNFTFNSVCVSYRLLNLHKATEVALPSLQFPAKLD